MDAPMTPTSASEPVPEAMDDAFATPAPAMPPQAASTRFQPSGTVGELLAWKEPKRSAAVYGVVTVATYFSCSTNFPSLLCQLFVLHIVVLRVAMVAESKGLKAASALTKMPTPSVAGMEKAASAAVSHVEAAVLGYENTVSSADTTTLAALVFGLYVGSKVFLVISPVTILFVAFQGAFVGTPLYVKFQTQLDELSSQAMEIVQEKVVVPGAKKLSEVHEQVSVAATPYKEKVLGMLGRSPVKAE